jgi:hypothetical protein
MINLLFWREAGQVVMQRAVVTRHRIQRRRGLLGYETSHFHALVPELIFVIVAGLFKHLSDLVESARG